MKYSAIQTSQLLLSAIKNEDSPAEYIADLAKISEKELHKQLPHQDEVKTFWINTYNAYSTYLLKPQPEIILTQVGRLNFFNARAIIIAGKPLSLNDIEHGILRKSKLWWSRGYLTRRLVRGFERKFRVKHFDYRIHFALNCGGESCPPIRFYKPEKLEQQLEMATYSFLEAETSYNKETDTVTTSQILKWYIGDFDGSKGIITMLKKYKIIPDYINPKLAYKDYSWEVKVRFMT